MNNRIALMSDDLLDCYLEQSMAKKKKNASIEITLENEPRQLISLKLLCNSYTHIVMGGNAAESSTYK